MNTASAATRRAYSQWFSTLASAEKQLFNRYKVDNVEIATDSDYVKGLMALFNRR